MVSAPLEEFDITRVLGINRGTAPFSPAARAMAILASRDLAVRVVQRLLTQLREAGLGSGGSPGR